MRKVIVAFLLVSAFAQTKPQRSVRGETLVSPELPAARFTLSKNFHYVGGQVINLYGNAEAEQHLFVSTQNGLVKSFYWLQFEHFLPSNKMNPITFPIITMKRKPVMTLLINFLSPWAGM